jgi:hypothetical protein
MRQISTLLKLIVPNLTNLDGACGACALCAVAVFRAESVDVPKRGENGGHVIGQATGNAKSGSKVSRKFGTHGYFGGRFCIRQDARRKDEYPRILVNRVLLEYNPQPGSKRLFPSSSVQTLDR